MVWYWPDVFRATLKDRLELPTVKEVHLEGRQDLPLSSIDICKNTENLFLPGPFEATHRVCDSTPPQLKSLTLLTSNPG